MTRQGSGTGDAPKVIGLVPMKAHSERIPNKNLRPFCGRPLFHYILEALLACRYIEAIYIDTDGEAIAQEAMAHFKERVQILWRPESIRGDHVSMNVIIGHDVSQVPGTYFLQTHSTNPLLTSATITQAIERFVDVGDHDSLFSVTRIQARLYDRHGHPLNHDPREMRRTQDLAPIYEENSNLYLFSRSSFSHTGRRIGQRPLLFEMSKLEAMDIDDEEDFRLAESLCLIAQAQQVVARE